MKLLARTAIISVLLLFLACRNVRAQTDAQLWGNLTFSWPESDRITYGLDFEPRVLVSKPEEDPGWAALYVTPSATWDMGNWLDVNGDLVVAYTNQTDGYNTSEVRPRVGARLHLLSRDTRRLLHHERPPKRRVVIDDLVRVEWRNVFYTDETPTSSTSRLRNRLEFSWPLNHEKMTEPRTCSWLFDWEWFVPIGEPDERFSTNQRIRTGLGYRRNAEWKFNVLYMWMRSRDTRKEDYRTTDNVMVFQFKRVFK
jgi:hypothetical protein